MKKNAKYIIITVGLVLITLSLFSKYNELKNIKFDGDGIGIYYFPFVNNDSVPNEDVVSYAKGFLFASIIYLLAAVSSIFLYFKDRTVY